MSALHKTESYERRILNLQNAPTRLAVYKPMVQFLKSHLVVLNAAVKQSEPVSNSAYKFTLTSLSCTVEL